jgi:tetratricopeptide (TPR) repeat protein
MGKTWAAWIKWTLGAFASTGVFGTASYLSATASFHPPPPDPGFFDICVWALSGQDSVALGTALMAGLGAAASVVQLFGPKPATRADVIADGRRTREGVEHVSAQVAAEGRAAEVRDSEMLDELKAQKHGFTPDDIRDHRISEGKAFELGEALVDYLRENRPELAEEMVARIGGVFVRAAESEDERARQVAALMTEGRFAEAGDLQRQIAADRDSKSAQAHRDAGSILVITDLRAAVSEYLKAVDLDPTNFATWIQLSRLKLLIGDFDQARRCGEQALQHAATEREASVAETELGTLAIVAGDLSEARRRFEAGLNIDKRMAGLEPGNTEWQRDLSISLIKLGDVERDAGDLGAARERYEAGLAIAEDLTVLDPDNTEWQRDLSVSLNKLGEVERDAGDLGAARKRFERSLAIREKLAALEPTNIERQRDLLVSLGKLGVVERSAGDLRAAWERFEAGLAIAEDLTALEPANTEWQRDLSVNLEKLGEVERDAGDLGAAREHFEASLAIREKLTALEPANTEWQRDLSVSLSKLGQVERDAGDLGAARERFEASRAIAAKLASREPDNTEWQRDLFISLAQLAQVAEQDGNAADAIRLFHKAEAIMSALTEAHVDHPRFTRDLEHVRRDISRLSS